MAHSARPATVDDIPRLVELLLMDAEERRAKDPNLWRIASNAASQIEQALTFALTAEKQPFQQFWHVAEASGQITGVAHAMMLPVPPIYAGAKGDPGLILPDCFAAPDAPEGTITALVDAAEDVLRQAGAQIIVSSFVTGDEWRRAFQESGYLPLTLYFSRSGFGDAGAPSSGRPATESDVPGIVARSAENRQILFEIDPFWEAHPEADPRFMNWMKRSLTLTDRDMMVTGTPEALDGYAIAQPASRLHFPPAHDITGTGVIDDYFHRDFADPAPLSGPADGSLALLQAAEAAFSKRGLESSFVVCPAGWRSKIDVLTSAGYSVAMEWSLKRL